MFLFKSEAILGRIHAHLAAWRAGHPSAELLAAVRDEFHALKDGAAAAGFNDVSELSHSVGTLLARNDNVVDSDDVALLNLLEEIHDGLKADLGFVPAVSREHVQSLNSMMASLSSGETGPTQSAENGQQRPDEREQAIQTARGERAEAAARQSPEPPGARVSVIGDYLPRLQRIAGEIAGRSNKLVELSLYGGDIETDRQVMDLMMAPFEQMIRNSIEHGIESAEQRKESGKEATGRIHIAVIQQGAALMIEYADDGNGLNRKKLLADAVEMGLTGGDKSGGESGANAGSEFGGEAGANIGEQHLLQIIIQPAYRAAKTEGKTEGKITGKITSKTTSKTDGKSGSGGGMDTVYRAVRELGGLMAVKSEDGEGIRFQFRLPPTLAESRVLMVTLGRFRFALRARTVERLMRVPQDEVVERDGRRYARVGVRQIPIIDLAGQIGESGVQPAQSIVSLVLIRLADRITAFEVDEFHHIIDVVNKTPGRQPATIRGLAGVAILADFSAVMILDPGAFIDRRALQSDGLTQFPLSYSGSVYTLADSAADLRLAAQAESKKTMRVVALETKFGPLLIPVGMVAAIIGTVKPQPFSHRHGWVCGEFPWCGFRVPLIDSESALGADDAVLEGEVNADGKEGARQYQHAVILWPMKDGQPDEFFALTSHGPPGVIKIDPRPAPAPPPAPPGAVGQPDNLLGYAQLEHRIGLIPDLKSLARGVFHGY